MSVNDNQQPDMSGLMRWMMWVCCAMMLAPVIVFFAQGGSLGDARGVFGALLPVALCVGMHFVLHRFIGVSCHKSGPKADDQNDPADVHRISGDEPISSPRIER